MGMQRPPAIALMGPTASGKSALALEWAERLQGEIVSVDSALVYRGLDIGAAKPTREEQARVPHHLLDVRDPWQPYSAADFARDAAAAIDGILARGRIPILAGGTGLYFRALLDGLADMPAADPAVRLAGQAQSLVTSGILTAALRVPGSIAPLQIAAELRSRRVAVVLGLITCREKRDVAAIGTHDG